MNRIDALNLINTIKDIVNEEIKEAKIYLSGIDENDFDYESVYQTIYPKIYRIYSLIEFLDKQNKKFSQYQQKLYKDYEDSTKLVLNKRQGIYKIIEEKYSIEKENLFDKWMKTGPAYNEKCLKQNILISNLKDLISYIR